jgi:hypothetical protein
MEGKNCNLFGRNWALVGDRSGSDIVRVGVGGVCVRQCWGKVNRTEYTYIGAQYKTTPMCKLTLSYLFGNRWEGTTSAL